MVKCAMDVRCIPQYASVAYDSSVQEFIVDVQVQVPESAESASQDGPRAAVDLVCVIDRSGSMAGGKMELLKQTLVAMIDQLMEGDQMAVVLFDSEIDVLSGFVQMDAKGRSKLTELVESITTRGCTNLCGGLVKGVELMRERKHKNDVASIFLFTDGEANEGYTALQDIIRAAEDPVFAQQSTHTSPRVHGFMNVVSQGVQQVQNFFFGQPMRNQSNANIVQQQCVVQQSAPMFPDPDADPQVVSMQSPPPQTEEQPPQSLKPEVQGERLPIPCSVNCFGFGESHNDELLKKLAEHCRGMYYFIENRDRVVSAFADALGGLVSTAAQNIEVEVSGSKLVTLTSVLSSYKTTMGTNSAVIRLGDIQVGEKRDVLVQLRLPKLSAREDGDVIVTIAVRYLNVLTKADELVTSIGVISRPPGPVQMEEDRTVSQQVNRFVCSSAMEKARALAEADKLDKAKQVLKEAVERISGSLTAKDPFCVGLIADIEKCSSLLKNRETYQQEGGKALSTNMASHQNQRSTNQGYEAQSEYFTASRSKMSSKLASKVSM